MSEFTFTGYKKRIKEYVTEHAHEVSDSKISRLALSLMKRQARMLDEDLERIFTHSDETPRLAIANLTKEGHPIAVS